MRKLTPEKIRQIRALKTRCTQREIAERVGVSKGSVSAVLGAKPPARASKHRVVPPVQPPAPEVFEEYDGTLENDVDERYLELARNPADLAQLILDASIESLWGWVREDGETDDAFAAYAAEAVADQRARALALIDEAMRLIQAAPAGEHARLFVPIEEP